MNYFIGFISIVIFILVLSLARTRDRVRYLEHQDKKHRSILVDQARKIKALLILADNHDESINKFKTVLLPLLRRGKPDGKLTTIPDGKRDES